MVCIAAYSGCCCCCCCIASASAPLTLATVETGEIIFDGGDEGVDDTELAKLDADGLSGINPADVGLTPVEAVVGALR